MSVCESQTATSSLINHHSAIASPGRWRIQLRDGKSDRCWEVDPRRTLSDMKFVCCIWDIYRKHERLFLRRGNWGRHAQLQLGRKTRLYPASDRRVEVERRLEKNENKKLSRTERREVGVKIRKKRQKKWKWGWGGCRQHFYFRDSSQHNLKR